MPKVKYKKNGDWNDLDFSSGGSGSASIDDTNTSVDKTWSSDKINKQFNTIANETVVENGKLYLVRKDGTKIDTGTTLPTGGEVTDEQVQSAVTNYFAENPIEVGNSKNGYTYKYMGTPFQKLNSYQSWPIAGVQYDKSLDRVMCLVTDADKHVSATQYKLSLYSLNPQTCEVELIQTLKDNTVEPVISLSDAFGSQRGFLIDNDTGIYYKFHFGDDKIPKACKSEDKGVTWTDIPITETNSSSILFAGGNGQIIKTSSGRIICGLFGNGFAYTDDYFQNLTYVTSGRIASGGDTKIHEYEIIELEENELVALCRYSWNPTADGNWSANESAYLDEMAWITYSHDNGATWTVPVATNMRMDATNCCSFIDDDNYVNLFVGTRFFADGTTTFKNGMYFLKVSKDDLKNNNLKTGELMFYGNSQFYSDFGNLACCVDCRNNVHLFYNDGKESGTCRWHYIKGSKTTVNNSSIQENPTNKEIQTYNAIGIDTLLSLVYAHIGVIKNELLLKIGELPDSGGVENPTFWVTNSLISYVEIKESDLDYENGTFNETYGNYAYSLIQMTGKYDGTPNKTSYNPLFLNGNNTMKSLFTDLFASETGYTIEHDVYGKEFSSPSPLTIGNVYASNGNTNNSFYLSDGWNSNINEYSLSEAIANTLSTVGYSNYCKDNRRNTIAYIFDKINNCVKIAINGEIIATQTDVTTEGFTLFPSDSYFASYAKSIVSKGVQNRGFRFYTKALSETEILQNANYSNTLI